MSESSQSCEQAKGEKALYGECFYAHSVTIVIYRVGRIEDRENKRGCQRNKWLCVFSWQSARPSSEKQGCGRKCVHLLTNEIQNP